MHSCTHTHARRLHARTHARTHTHTHTHTRTHARAHTCKQCHNVTYVYTHSLFSLFLSYTRAHTYIRTHDTRAHTTCAHSVILCLVQVALLIPLFLVLFNGKLSMLDLCLVGNKTHQRRKESPLAFCL